MALVAALKAWDEPSTSAEGLRRWQDLAQASVIAKSYLDVRDVSAYKGPVKPVETPDIKQAIHRLAAVGRTAELYQDFLNGVHAHFYLVKADIDSYVARIKCDDSDDNTDKVMAEMLERLALWQRAWGVPLKAMGDPKLIPKFTTAFHQLLHAALPASFPELLRRFLQSSLTNLVTSLPSAPPGKISPPSPHLSRLGIIPRYSATLSRVAYEEIEKIAREEADTGWDIRRMAKARQRVADGVATWLGGIFDGNEAAQAALRPMFTRFDYHLCKCIFDIRTDELFDIIVDYPDSMAALEDLKECLFKVDQRSILVDKLKASNVKRLLHPGAETKDVITQYISTIRCLRILDPPGVLLHKVADPIRHHLRDRPDTIRCIVATLVEGEELQDENELNGIIQENNDAVEDFLDPKWEPEPVDAAPEFRSGKASDIISTLVSIYQTKEVIIKELQILLATRLLAVKDYDAVREIRTIELLKIRFGEAALQVCDVMLKDMADSKRINDHVHSELKSSVNPLVISRMFWPNIQTSPLHLTPQLEQVQRDYESAFHRFKPDKHLKWLQHLGTAIVKLELEDRVVEVEATPLQASVAELFSEKPSWSIPDLGVRLGIEDEGTVKNAVLWWSNEGVLSEQDDVWVLLEREGQLPEAGTADIIAEGDGIDRLDEAKADAITDHWPKIRAVLIEIGPQTTEAIHRKLHLTPGYDQTIDELDMFLINARHAGAVILHQNGRYTLPS